MTYRALKFISRHLWFSSVLMLVVLALSLTAARILLPMLQDYRGEVAAEVGERVQREVTIEAFEIGWHGLGPRVFLHEVRLLADDGHSTLLSFKKAHVDIDLLASLLDWQLNIGRLSLNGVELQLVRHEDGRFGLAGMDVTDAVVSHNDSDAALRWLMNQGQLQVLNSTVWWRDLRTGETLKFHDVNLQLDNSGAGHRLSGHLQLPSAYGDRLHLAVDLQDSELELERLNGRVYLQGEGLRLSRWLAGVDRSGLLVERGSLDAQLWLDINDGVLDTVKGTLDGDDMLLVGDGARSARLDAVYGEFVWQRRLHGWELDIDRFRPRIDGVAWPATRMLARYSKSDATAQLELASDFIDLEDVATFSTLLPQLSPQLRDLLLQSRPRGRAAQAYVSLEWSSDEVTPPRYFISSRISNLGLQAVNALPGFDGLDGALNMTQDGGVFELASRGGFFDSQGLFRDFIAIEQMAGRIDWRRREDGWHVFIDDLSIANQDIQSLTRGSLLFPNDGRKPVVSLFGRFHDGDGRSTSRYLPVKLLSPATVAWLDRAIQQGRVRSGAMVLSGALDHFPFDDGSGRFEIRFDVESGVLDYADEWPPLTGINAEILFQGRSMTIFGRQATILNSVVEGVEVHIPDLGGHPPMLQVNGKVRGDAADILKVLTESPLRQRFADFLGNARGSGDGRLELGFNLPLAGGEAPTVKGQLRLTGAELEFEEYGLDLRKISGVLGFSESGITAHGVEARVMGQAVTIDINTETKGGKRWLQFNANGHSDLAALARRQPLPVYAFLQGNAPWRANFRVATDDAKVAPILRIDTDLKGVAINLPAPLAKPASKPAPLTVQAEFLRTGANWRIEFDRRLYGLFDIPQDSAQGRGSIALGTAAVLPQAPGMRLAVRQSKMDMAAWLSWLTSDATADKASNKASKTSSSKTERKDGDKDGLALRWIELDVERARLGERTLHGMKAKGVLGKDAWRIELDSTEAEGVVSVPLASGAPLQMDFVRLLLLAPDAPAAGASKATADTTINPAELPPLRIRSDYFVVADMKLGQLELRTSPREQGLTIERLRLDSPAAEVNLKGSWTRIGKRHSSAINGRIDIRDFGDFQSNLGYAASIDDGEGPIDFDLQWGSPLIDPQFELLRGKASFNIKDGRLLDVEPGAGRLLGMFGIGTLSRRMTLDFSDVFSQGFAFDEMEGQFAVVDGSVFTRDSAGESQPLKIKGPAANIELRGRAGFVDRDYDQLVAVTPHVTASLPVWGAVAGGLTTGAAVLLMERLLRSKIDDATRFYYRVHGSWDQPQMDAVDAQGQLLSPAP